MMSNTRIRSSRGKLPAISCLIILGWCVPALSAYAQGASATVTSSIIPGGERLTLSSKILAEDRSVFVSLPASYERGAQRYPVIYMTDAQFNFETMRSSARFLSRNKMIPEVIIIGVTNVDRTHDLYATRADFKRDGLVIPFPNSGNADRFLEFIEKELIPWAEARYRTLPVRVLAGQSAGGYFSLHAMRMKPSLFWAVIATSPWLLWDDRKELKELLPFLTSTNMRTRELFFSYADEGPEMKIDIDALTRALRSRSDASVRWESATYPDETHDSTAIKSYYDALRMIFAGWNPPRDPRTFLLAGSLEDIKVHFARLGEQLGVALLPPEDLVNELGYQYLHANNVEAAIQTFRFNTAEYPQSANVWDSLGEALERAGKSDEALATYRKALSVAEANGDTNIETYRRNVIRLSEVLRKNPK